MKYIIQIKLKIKFNFFFINLIILDDYGKV